MNCERGMDMKKNLVLLMMLFLSLLVFTGCAGNSTDNNETPTEETPTEETLLAIEDLTAEFIYDDFSGENGSSNKVSYDLTAEDLAVVYELLYERKLDREGDFFESIDPYAIEFSDGRRYAFGDSFDYYNYYGKNNKNGCGYFKSEEAKKLHEVVSHYIKIDPLPGPSYDLRGDPITLYYHTSSGWQSVELKGKTAKSVETILNIEELEDLHKGHSIKIVYYLDFHNGTGLTVYEDGYGEINIGVDSAVYREWILDGDDPTITFDRGLGSTILPEGTMETIEEALANSQ